jgi:hypothetical protein
MFVGSQAKILAIFGAVAPRLVDKLMEFYAFPSQQADRPSRNREDNALYRPGYGLEERGTHQGWIRSGSLYVQATTHPMLTTVALVGLGLAALSLSTNLVKR